MLKEFNPMATDIQENSRFLTFFPTSFHPYLILMRLDRPIGTLLIMLPALWGLAYGARTYDVPRAYWLIFMAGAFLMRSAGCVLNDLADRDIDAAVTRTKGRPLAAKTLMCLCVLLSASLCLLFLLNSFCWMLGVTAAILVAIYPWMKRITHWPQLFLGLLMNWGCLMSMAALSHTLEPSALLLWALGICWTFFYDTIYAHQDKRDDLMVGVKSSALKLGANTKPVLHGTLVLLAVIGVYLGTLSPRGPLYYAGLLVGVALLMRALNRVNLDDPGDCLKAFKESQIFGWFYLVVLLIG
jgi:4-hydroxybenzoate polyprenyltransferase